MADLEMNDRSLQVPPPNIINDAMIITIDNNNNNIKATTDQTKEKPSETTKTTSYLKNSTENTVESSKTQQKSLTTAKSNNNNNSQSDLQSDSFDISVDDQVLLSSYIGKIENMSTDEFTSLPDNDKKVLSKYIDTEPQVLTNDNTYQVVKTNHRTPIQTTNQYHKPSTISTNQFAALNNDAEETPTTTSSQQSAFTFGDQVSSLSGTTSSFIFRPIITIRPKPATKKYDQPTSLSKQYTQYSSQHNRHRNQGRGGREGGRGARGVQPPRNFRPFNRPDDPSSSSDSDNSTDTIATNNTASPIKV
jgi:hypothetical protein